MAVEPIIGIDLGTTNSEVAVIENGRPRVLPDENGRTILPSFVGLSDDGRLLVGEAARNQWLLAPQRTIRSVKRRMGEQVKLPLGDQQVTPQEVSAMILRTLKQRAERGLGQPVSKAVITVPAYFNDAQRQATREAGELADLDVVRILNEPTAASLVYEASQTASHRIMVYDLGGGTFDVSIVNIEKGVVEVLASHGDTHLGGDDFDALLMEHVAGRFKEAHGIDLREDPRAQSVLWRAVEDAKVRLSSQPFAQVKEEFIAHKDGRPLHLDMEIDRQTYENMIRPLIERTMDAMQIALREAGVSAGQIDRIVLAGGATRTPLVSSELQRRTGREPHQEVDPDLCVAMGAAIQAGIIAGEEVGAVLVDVTPYSFGVRHLGEYHGLPYPYCYKPIIHRNTPLPTSRTEAFGTIQDDQEEVVVDVYQGEHEDAQENTAIGSFRIKGLSKVPAPNLITCRLDLDLDGILKVTAQEKRTGLAKHIVIDNAMGRFGVKELDAAAHRLRVLWGDEETDGDEGAYEASDTDAVAAAEEEPACILLARARQLLPQLAESDRSEVFDLIAKIEGALEANGMEEARGHLTDLEDILFYLEESR